MRTGPESRRLSPNAEWSTEVRRTTTVSGDTCPVDFRRQDGHFLKGLRRTSTFCVVNLVGLSYPPSGGCRFVCFVTLVRAPFDSFPRPGSPPVSGPQMSPPRPGLGEPGVSGDAAPRRTRNERVTREPLGRLRAGGSGRYCDERVECWVKVGERTMGDSSERTEECRGD